MLGFRSPKVSEGGGGHVAALLCHPPGLLLGGLGTCDQALVLSLSRGKTVTQRMHSNKARRSGCIMGLLLVILRCLVMCSSGSSVVNNLG